MPRSCKRDWFTSHKNKSKTNHYHLCLKSRGVGGGGGFRKLQCPLAEFGELLQGNLSHQVESVVGLWMHLMDCSDCSIASQRNQWPNCFSSGLVDSLTMSHDLQSSSMTWNVCSLAGHRVVACNDVQDSIQSYTLPEILSEISASRLNQGQSWAQFKSIFQEAVIQPGWSLELETLLNLLLITTHLNRSGVLPSNFHPSMCGTPRQESAWLLEGKIFALG